MTKLRLYNAIEKTGNGVITDAGVNPGREDLTRMAIKMPETDPKTGRTRVVEKSLWIKKSLARETRDVLNTDQAAPTNPVFKALTQLQLFQLTDATAHMKNIHTIVANSLGASKPWQDAVRKMPFLATADTVGRIAQVTREVAADTPAIRDEISQMAKQGMIRPQYPATGIQKITKMQDAIHHVDTASRIIMNRFWDNLVERGMVNDSMQARRAFVQQIGEILTVGSWGISLVRCEITDSRHSLLPAEHSTLFPNASSREPQDLRRQHRKLLRPRVVINSRV